MYSVLIVDDEPFIRKGLKAIIDWHRHGFEICGESGSAQEAIQLIREQRPNLVITDIRMPVMDGLELIRQVTETMAERPKFIILSGYSEFKYARTAMQYQVNNYILKPIDEEEMAANLQQIRCEIDRELEQSRLERIAVKFEPHYYLREILNNNVTEEHLQKMTRCFGIAPDSPLRFVLVDPGIEDSPEPKQEDDSLAAVRAAILGLVGPEHVNHVLDEEFGKFGLLLNRTMLERFQGDACLYGKALFDRICATADCRPFISLGREVRHAADIRQSYRSAYRTKRYQSLAGESGVMAYEDVNAYNNSYDFCELTAVTDLIQAIDQGQEDRIQLQTDHVFAEAQHRRTPPELLRSMVSYFILVIVEFVDKQDGDTGRIFENDPQLFRRIHQCSIPDLKQLLVQWCVDTARYLKELRSSQSFGIVAKVAAYMQSHYAEEITLKEMADRYYMNSAYLGQLFKKTYNVYFNDYLHGLRIEEAKVLLRRADLKVYEVAKMVGYHNSDYFLSKFEKHTNETPSQFRKRLSENNP